MSASPTASQRLPLDAEAIRRGAKIIGKDLRYFIQTPSTNLELHRLAAEEYRHGIACITDFQSAGRGRLGRAWLAPERTCLLLSVAILYPSACSPALAVMLAALAVGDAIEIETGLTPAIKWPNDILLAGKKTAGILSEFVTVGMSRYAILGIGINVNVADSEDFPPEWTATSLSRESGRPVNRERLAIALFHSLDMWYGVLTERPEKIFSSWSARLTMLGEPVVIMEGTRPWDGVALRVEPDGGLRVRTTEGSVRTVYAADVSLRSAACQSPIQ